MLYSGFYIDFSKLENFAYDAEGNLILWRNGSKKNMKSVMKSGFQGKYSQNPNSLNMKVQVGTKLDKRPLVFTFNKDPGTTKAGAVGKDYTYKIKIPKADIEKFKFTDKNPEFHSRNSYPKFLSDEAKKKARYYKQHPEKFVTWNGTPATMKDTSIVTGLHGLNEQSKQIFKKRFKNLTDKEVAKLDKIIRINEEYFPKSTIELYNTDSRNKLRLNRLSKLNGIDVSEDSFRKVIKNTNSVTSNIRKKLDYKYFKELSGIKGSPTTIIEGDIPAKYIQFPQMKPRLSYKLSSVKNFMKSKVFLGVSVLSLVSLLISGNIYAKQRAKDKERFNKIMDKIKEGKDYTKTDLEWIESVLRKQLRTPDVYSEKQYRTTNNKLNASIQEIKAALKEVQYAKERLGN